LGNDRDLLIVSNSKKTVALIRAKHTAYLEKRRSLETFAGYLEALAELKLIEFEIRSNDQGAAAPPTEAIV
jgi:hypothetical protein